MCAQKVACAGAQVPPGTILRRRDAPEGERPLAELVLAGERALLAPGGRGGRGNASFKTGRNKCAVFRPQPTPSMRFGIFLGSAQAASQPPACCGLVSVPERAFWYLCRCP